MLTAEELAALKTASPKAHDAYLAQQTELTALKAAKPAPEPDPKPNPDTGLDEKARLAAAEREKSAARETRLASAVRFDIQSKEFLKANETLLPEEAAGVFAEAEKDKFDDAVQKDESIKAGLITAFFRVQTNVDLLTQGQKSRLDEYLKLTKTGKQEKAQGIYDMVFEPALEKLRDHKRAEALSRGHSTSESADGYKKKMIEHSTKHYLREKTGNA